MGRRNVRVDPHNLVETGQLQQLLHLPRSTGYSKSPSSPFHQASANSDDTDSRTVNEIQSTKIQNEFSEPLHDVLADGTLNIGQLIAEREPSGENHRGNVRRKLPCFHINSHIPGVSFPAISPPSPA